MHGYDKSYSITGEKNVFYLTIQQTAKSAADVQGMQLTDYFPSNTFAFLGASIPPDSTNGGVLVWSNSTLMGAIPNEPGGPYSVTNAGAISLVVTSLTLVNCSVPAVNSAVLNYGCANSLCQSASNSVTVAMTPNLQIQSASESMQLNSCGGTYSVTIANQGAPATFVEWTNLAPPGYLITAATVSGAFYTEPGQFARLTLGGPAPYVGQYAVLDLSSTSSGNVYGPTNYAYGAPGTLYLGPGQSFTVTFTLVSDGSTLDCTVNQYPAEPSPVTVSNSVTYYNFCDVPATAEATFTALPDQPRPAVTIDPREIIVTNGQVQDFTVTVENIGTHGDASDLQARILFQPAWTNILILGWTNNASGTTNGFIIETNAQNGVLVNLGGIVLAPLQTVTIGLSAVVQQNGNPLTVTAEVVGGCGSPSPVACTSFSPSTPLAMTMPPSPDIPTNSNNTIYGFYQDNSEGVGFTLAKTVRYAGEDPSLAGNSRVARIGENLVYRITATFFDAPFTNIVINDSLPPNLVYGPPVDAGSSPNIVNNWTYNNGNFTLPTPVTGDAVFVVDFPATNADSLINRAGVAYTNTATATFTTVVTNIPPSVSTVVSEVEPTLYVTNLVSTTDGNFMPSVSGVQAGDTLFYEMVITNVSATNAYNLWLSNSLPPGFTSPTVVSVASTGVVVTNGVPAGVIVMNSLFSFTNNTLNLATNEIDISSNSSLTVVISTRPGYNVQPYQVLGDDATIQWSSMPGFQPQERTGVGQIPLPGINDFTNDNILDNYADTATAAASGDAGILFSKVLFGTSVTAPGNGATNLAIGELATYTLTLTVPQGTTTNAVIVDTLPAGLAFVGVSNVTWSSQVTNDSVNYPVAAQVSSPGRTITFNLGAITNLNSDDAAHGLTIQFSAVALDVLGNQAGVTLQNQASFSTGTTFSTNVVDAGVSVVEPTLQVLELVATNFSGAPGVYGSSVPGAYGTSVVTVQGHDTVYYQLLITNSAGVNGTTAYNLFVSNNLPAGMVNPQI